MRKLDMAVEPEAICRTLAINALLQQSTAERHVQSTGEQALLIVQNMMYSHKQSSSSSCYHNE
jgi:hypothetical protein